MNLCLKEITRVYRFGIHEHRWERKASAGDHFIAYKLYGNTVHEIGGKSFPFSKDMIMIANSEDLYRVTWHEAETEGKYGSCIAVHFTTLQPFDRHFTIYDVRKYPSLKNEFFRILDLWNQFKSDGSLSVEYAAVSCFYQIFARLTAITLTENQKTEADGFLVKAREYLERNYANSTLSVSDAASVAGLSVRRFGELFHESFGETPGHYLTNVRMNAALELLRRSSLSVAEIAALSGYADASYFIRVFHSRTGVSPAVYRKRAEKK